MQVEIGRSIPAGDLLVVSPCARWSVRAVLDHSIGVTQKFTDFASGATDRPRSPLGDLVGEDHVVALRTAADASRAAWAAADMARRCHLPFGVVTAAAAVRINLFDVLAHTWDVATATRLDVTAPDELWRMALDAAREAVGPARDLRHYAPELRVAPGADPRERFVRFLGRR